ncbi:unnamed protein product [Timema podura]|uniref:Uncharacterized protein n=1 Tax=Timema podura TaxID=61482 RepID=A0ABN7NLX2_TIMPD|nr:unnamed protein product [Timema podura]
MAAYKWAWSMTIVCVITLVSPKESVTSTESATTTESEILSNSSINAVDLNEFTPAGNGTSEGRDSRKGKNLLDWIGFGTGADTDPYLAKINSACLEGDLSECFKSRALATLDEFFGKEAYTLTENARVVRMPETQLRQLHQEPYEFSTSSRADEPEWDQFVKFMLRKVEKFLKSTAIEVQFPSEITEQGRYSPRFIDEIASEIDILEDKKASLFCKYYSWFECKRGGVASLSRHETVSKRTKRQAHLVWLAGGGEVWSLNPSRVSSNCANLTCIYNYGAHGHSNYYHQPPQHHQYTSGGHYSSGSQPTYYGSPYNRDADVLASGHQPVYQPSGEEYSHESSPIAFRDQRDAHQMAYQGYQQYQTR